MKSEWDAITRQALQTFLAGFSIAKYRDAKIEKLIPCRDRQSEYESDRQMTAWLRLPTGERWVVHCDPMTKEIWSLDGWCPGEASLSY